MTSYSIDPNPEDIGLFDAKSKQNAFFIRNWTYLLNLEYAKARSVGGKNRGRKVVVPCVIGA